MRGLLLLWAFALTEASAQALDPRKALSQYVLDRWQQEQGLPQNTVHALLQSRDGYLWVGTYQGAARFDGVRFEVFNMANTPAFKSNGIWAISEDHRGHLWFGTNGGGLTRLADGRFRTYGTAEGLSSAIVRILMRDSDQALWAAYPTGVSRISVSPEGRLSVKHVEGLENQNPLALVQDRAGTRWVGCREGLFRIVRRDSVWSASRQAGLMGRTIYALWPDPDGSLWVGTDDGLFRFDGGEFRRIGREQGLSENRIARIYKDRASTLWVVTVGGELNRYAEGRFSHLSIRDDFQDNRIFAILEDREGSLWFGTSRSGLNRFKESKVSSYGRPEGMAAEVTYAVHQGPDGTMYLGTNGGGVSLLQGERITHLTRAQGLSGSYVRALASDAQGRLWVSCYGAGVDVMTGNRRVAHFSPREGLLDEFVRVIKPMPDGSVWLGTRRGLNRIIGGRVVGAYGPERGLPAQGVLCIESAGPDRLFVGTDGGGLATLTAGRFESVTTQQGLPSDVVLALLWDRRDQSLWVGTNNGLALLRKGQIFTFRAPGLGMPESVLQLLDDETGLLWMGSTNGIYAVPKSALYAYADKRIASLDVKHYGRADGLRSIECTPNGHPSATRSTDGRLWFPTSKGVAVVDPWQIPLNRQVPRVAIERAVVGDSIYALADQLVVEPGTPRFELHYTALSFMVPEKVRFQYRLEGYDDRWVDAGNRRIAYYTNLPAGKYTFAVRACNNDGLWNEVGASLSLTVLPHYYQTWWFIALMGIVLIGLGAVLYRVRVTSLHRQNLVLEAMVESRTAELRSQSEQLRHQTDAMTLSNTNLSVLAEIGQEITATLDAEELFGLLERSMHRLMEFDVFTVHEYAPDRHQLLRIYAVEGGQRQPMSIKSMDDPSSLAVWCVRNRRPAMLRDYDNEYMHYTTALRQFTLSKMRSVMVAPMMVKEKVLGCVGVQSSRLDAFQEWQFEMLQTIAAYGGIALDNAKSYDTIQRVNLEMGNQNQRLAKALDDLKAAQDQLIFSEKMAALGQLVASVAHEINTPISAITTTTRTTDRVLPELVTELPQALHRLRESERALLQRLVEQAAVAAEFPTTRAERQARSEMRDYLAHQGVEAADTIAMKLAQMRMQMPLADYLPVLQHPEASHLLTVAAKLAGLRQNNDLVRRAAEKTTKIVSALKAYAHPSRGDERHPVALSESIDNVLTLYTNHFRQGIELVRDYDPTPGVPVFADEIEQVWSNLIHNALLAMRSGGRLTISLRSTGAWVHVTFTDTGVGIPPEILPHIFDPFFTTRAKGEGSGLGLDIVRRIIEKHNGSISVDSVPGRTAFEVRLPLLVP